MSEDRDVYRRISTGHCWMLEEEDEEVVVLQRGSLLMEMRPEDFEAQFEFVA